MSEKKRTQQLLKRFEAAERDAIEGVLRRIGRTEAKISETVGKVPRSLGRELDVIRGRLEDARRSAEDRVEEFRSKLIDGPLTEEELRARLVILDMEYASRVRLAEQGFDLLAERFEDHVASGKHWLTDVCDQVRQAVRLDVKPVREQLGEALVQRAGALAAQERELEELRRYRETLAPLEAKIAALEGKNRALESQLVEFKGGQESSTESNERLETRVIELTRELQRYKNENADLSVRLGQVEGEADLLLQQLQGKEGSTAEDERTLIEKLRTTITPLLDERLGLRSRVQTLEERIEALKASEAEMTAMLEIRGERGNAEADAKNEEALAAAQQRIKEQAEEISENERTLAEFLQELAGFRAAAGRFRERVQVLEIDLSSAKAELKEMRQERRGLVERFNAASQARDVERKRAEKAEAALESAKAAPPPAPASGRKESRVVELEMKLAAAARGLSTVREKVEAARARIKELEARTIPERDQTLDIDAEKAELSQLVEGKSRENQQLSDELKKSRSALEAAQKAWVSMRKQLAESQQKAASAAVSANPAGGVSASPAVSPDVAALREEIRAARAAHADVSEQLAKERKSAKMMQKRLFEADVARDRALTETRAQWADEQERYEEQLSDSTRETTMLRTQLETTERSWQETLARQDADRMQEIFKLRAEIQKLKWKLEEKGK